MEHLRALDLGGYICSYEFCFESMPGNEKIHVDEWWLLSCLKYHTWLSQVRTTRGADTNAVNRNTRFRVSESSNLRAAVIGLIQEQE